MPPVSVLNMASIGGHRVSHSGFFVIHWNIIHILPNLTTFMLFFFYKHLPTFPFSIFLHISHKLKSLDGLGIFLNLNLNTSLLTPTDIWQELKGGERESVGMVCVCMFVYTFMYMCVCIHVDGYMCIYIGLCICLSACVCLSVSVYVHLFMYMCMCVHVYICM